MNAEAPNTRKRLKQMTQVIKRKSKDRNSTPINKQIMAAAQVQDSLLESNYPYLSVWEDADHKDTDERYVLMEYVAGTGGGSVIRLAHSNGRSILQTPQQMQANLVNVEAKLRAEVTAAKQQQSIVAKQNDEYDQIVGVLLFRSKIVAQKRWWHIFGEPERIRQQKRTLAELEVKLKKSELANRILAQ